MKTEEQLIWEAYFNYYTTKDELLRESPMRMDDYDSFNYEEDNPRDIYSKVLNPIYQYKLIHTQKHNNGVTISLFERHEGDDQYSIKLIPDNLKEVVGHIDYRKLNDGGIEIDSVYNQPLFKGIIFKLYFDYLLDRFSYIISGSVHSRKGEMFWQKVVDKGLSIGLNIVGIKNNSQFKINNINQLSELYGDNSSFEEYRIKIFK